ncbi:ATP-binding cassette domain-containing protein [Coleofasciculus sp. LEGE 07081]|uniref:ATP-binding cassette domain-containing protein n=1 Tax=Coleofasciculus sp. LEGE 07081 TaxID=2777967 RepID=UPI001D13848B|nr:ATP-binding cassette domain-containing protein [Coleofasciculus sp. LEGE 07081]
MDGFNSGVDRITSTAPQLQLKQVSLVTSARGAIPASPILTDISFDVFRGDRLCLIGSSGAGKTSLLRLLNRLSESTSGTIYLENQDIRQIPVLQLRRQVMLVPQEPKLLGMTVREALAYPLVLQQLPKNAIAQRLTTYRELLHIPADWLERTELQLSVGQRQLVAIARALVIEPKIVVLDEPTSALDAGIASYVLGVLADLAVQDKITVLMVNHQLDMAQVFSTRVLYLQEGRLLQDTSANQIDWKQLRERLVQAEAQAAREWL